MFGLHVCVCSMSNVVYVCTVCTDQDTGFPGIVIIDGCGSPCGLGIEPGSQENSNS